LGLAHCQIFVSQTLVFVSFAQIFLGGDLLTYLSFLSFRPVLFWTDENDITGTIPTEIGLLTKLTEFRIQQNALSGTIPSEFVNLKDLQVLSLSEQTSATRLTGTLPNIFDGMNLSE
jgi:hypothetical protein